MSYGWRNDEQVKAYKEGKADGQRDMLAKVDAVLGAIPTSFWINASTDEAQQHKRSVRAAVRALLTEGSE